MLEDESAMPPPPANDPSLMDGMPLAQEPGVESALPSVENLTDKYNYELPDWYALKAQEDQEQGVAINPEIAQALQTEAQALLAQGLTGTEVADRIGKDANAQRRASQLLYMLGKDLPGRDKPLEEPAPEWDFDEYFNAKCTVITKLQPELEARNQEYKHLTENLLENDLSYRDVLGDEAKRAGSNSDYPEHAIAYAHELVQMMLSDKGDALTEARNDIHHRFDNMRNLLPDGVELSPYAESKSWILWDIGKQEVLKDRDYRSSVDPELNYSGSALVDPADNSSSARANSMRDVIADRHFGWELHHKAFNGEDMSWLDSLLDGQTRELLHKVGDEAHHGQLASNEYADLGRRINNALHQKYMQDHPDLMAEASKRSKELLQALRPKEPLNPLKTSRPS